MRRLAVACLLVELMGTASAKVDHAAVARACVEEIGRGDYAAARKRFAPELAEAVDADRLAKGWTGSLAGAGPFAQVVSVRVEPGAIERAIVRARLAKGTIDVWLGFKAGSDAIVALHFDRADTWTAPAYVDASKFVEREVMVGAGKLALPGTLSVPRGKGPFPAVFLVHGSGPNDRDETSPGGAKLFRDLAQGLASRGVVVLRYDKRTHGHFAVLGIPADEVTIKEEYLDDVAAAAALLRATREVDAKRIYVLGHSEGGYLAPRFLAADPALAGAIILAGTARPLEDLLVPQLEVVLKGDPLAGLKIAEIKKQVARVKDPKLSPSTPAKDLPLGLPARYWLSLRGYDPLAIAAKEKRPLLVLQGERDYQSTPGEDFARWKKALAGHANAKLVLYPKLNHFFFAGEGPITPKEYAEKSGHAAVQVVADIATFVRR